MVLLSETCYGLLVRNMLWPRPKHAMVFSSETCYGFLVRNMLWSFCPKHAMVFSSETCYGLVRNMLWSSRPKHAMALRSSEWMEARATLLTHPDAACRRARLSTPSRRTGRPPCALAAALARASPFEASAGRQGTHARRVRRGWFGGPGPSGTGGPSFHGQLTVSACDGARAAPSARAATTLLPTRLLRPLHLDVPSPTFPTRDPSTPPTSPSPASSPVRPMAPTVAHPLLMPTRCFPAPTPPV
jgi:hypothetical protein